MTTLLSEVGILKTTPSNISTPDCKKQSATSSRYFSEPWRNHLFNVSTGFEDDLEIDTPTL